MKTARSARLLAGALCLALAQVLPAFAEDRVVPVVNADHSSVALGRDELRAIFMMRMREWPDGTPIRVVVLRDDDPLHDAFVRQQLGTYPYVLRSIWDRLVYTGTGFAPTVVRSEDELRQWVRATPGAIGYERETGR